MMPSSIDLSTMITRYPSILFLALVAISCADADRDAPARDTIASVPPATNGVRRPVLQGSGGTGQLIPIDYNDTGYFNFGARDQDTTLADGWSIRYLVKDDSTKYTDLYLEWSKGDAKGIYPMEDVLEMRRYFIPSVSSMSERFIYLEHGCATGCSAVLVLTKDTLPTVRDFEAMARYDPKRGRILYASDDDCARPHDANLRLTLMDLPTGKEYPIEFDGRLPQGACFPPPVDTVIFSESSVTVRALVHDPDNVDAEPTSTRTVRLAGVSR